MTDAARSLVATLGAIVGPSGLVEEADTEGYLTDFRRSHHGPALAVVRPRSTDEVAAVVAACARADVAIVPQGGNTGLCGGSVPIDGAERPSVVLSLSRMNRVIEINRERATATIEAGVTIEVLQQACAGHGLLFAPDWGARGTAQVGGGLSTNAGGINVLRWGTMREQVLGLEVVLADGRVWDGRRALRKDATGLDLKQLFIGAEGTLGVITGAVFRLHPLPTDHASAFVALSDLEALMPLLELARRRAGSNLSAFELIPELGMGWVLEDLDRARRPLERRATWYALLRFSGDEAMAEVAATVLAQAVEAELVVDAVVAATAEQEANLWLIRDELATTRRFDASVRVHKFDMAVPVDRVVDFLQAATRALDEEVPGTEVYAFGHVGDGNLHFSFFPGPQADMAAFERRSPALRDLVDELTWRFDGTISAEHGVGQEMRQRLVGQKPSIELELARTIKAVLDPHGLMNPGKVYP